MSQIIQMEVMDPTLVVNSDSINDSEVNSMKRMLEPVSLAEVPGRIIERRLENF